MLTRYKVKIWEDFTVVSLKFHIRPTKEVILGERGSLSIEHPGEL